ncbi:MAG: acyl carrier protein [Syntrophaceae bacterium]|nr:acyl carrier protein [Syntrophaceae bacterium]
MEEKVKQLILENFPSVPHHLENTQLLRENGFTSLMFVELILLLEKEFGIEVLDEEIGPGRFSTVARIAEYVQCKLEGRPVPPLPVCEECRSHG